jgi:hypothetical protein
MRRRLNEVAIADGRVRYTVVVEGDACEPGTDAARYRQYEFLLHLSNNQDLLACGPVMYEHLSIRHNGDRWVAEAQAVVSKRE